MTSLIYLIPILFAIILFIFFRTKVVWWEYLILIIPSMLLTLLISLGMISSRTTDTEYFGDYITEVRYYEAWDEWITETCTSTSTDANGNTTTTTYDCSHKDYHDAYWEQITSKGDATKISETEYNRLTKLWKTDKIFVDMNRDFDDNDGDMYKKAYDNNIYSVKTVTSEHTYENKINNSYSIFGFTKISPVEAKEKGLYDYPVLYSNNDGGSYFSNGTIDQSPFLGYNPTPKELSTWKYINGYYGPKNQIRIYLLFFYNKSRSIVKEQQSYWLGGNKNEMILCFGVDSVSKKLQWTDAFSWSDKPSFEVNFRSFYTSKDRVNLYELSDWAQNAIPQYWKRKEFKDFDYIEINLTGNQMMWLFIIIMIVNIGISIFVVLNTIEYDENGDVIGNNDKYNNYRY